MTSVPPTDTIATPAERLLTAIFDPSHDGDGFTPCPGAEYAAELAVQAHVLLDMGQPLLAQEDSPMRATDPTRREFGADWYAWLTFLAEQGADQETGEQQAKAILREIDDLLEARKNEVALEVLEERMGGLTGAGLRYGNDKARDAASTVRRNDDQEYCALTEARVTAQRALDEYGTRAATLRRLRRAAEGMLDWGAHFRAGRD